MAEKILSPFMDVQDVPLVPADLYGQDYLNNLSALQIGAGTKSLKADRSGMWLGGNRFANAPFSVDMLGNVIASSATFSAYATTAAALLKAGAGQTLSGDVSVGIGNVKIDGANKRIFINDGTNDRILIGFQSGGF